MTYQSGRGTSRDITSQQTDPTWRKSRAYCSDYVSEHDRGSLHENAVSAQLLRSTAIRILLFFPCFPSSAGDAILGYLTKYTTTTEDLLCTKSISTWLKRQHGPGPPVTRRTQCYFSFEILILDPERISKRYRRCSCYSCCYRKFPEALSLHNRPY